MDYFLIQSQREWRGLRFDESAIEPVAISSRCELARAPAVERHSGGPGGRTPRTEPAADPAATGSARHAAAWRAASASAPIRPAPVPPKLPLGQAQARALVAGLQALAGEPVRVAVHPRAHRRRARAVAEVLGSLLGEVALRGRARSRPATDAERRPTVAGANRPAARAAGAGANPAAPERPGPARDPDLDRGEPVLADQRGDLRERLRLRPRTGGHLEDDRRARDRIAGIGERNPRVGAASASSVARRGSRCGSARRTAARAARNAARRRRHREERAWAHAGRRSRRSWSRRRVCRRGAPSNLPSSGES